MALIVNTSTLGSLTLKLTPTKPSHRRFFSAVRSSSQDSSDQPSDSDAQPKKLGFGAPNPTPTKDSGKKKRKGKRERASIIRRNPVEKPVFSAAALSAEEEEKAKESGRNENAFLLAWLVLGGIILAQGIALSASGFLPEEWDRFFVKYLYPSFTPTVGLFVAGTVTYGVTKYLQNEKLKDQK